MMILLSATIFSLDKAKLLLYGKSKLSPKPHIKDFSKLKEFADNDENGSNLLKWVENIVGKGEIAHLEQFLFFPQCFILLCILVKTSHFHVSSFKDL